MIFKNLKYLLIILISFNTFAKSEFLKTCESNGADEEVFKIQVEWLKHFFETKSCKDIRKKISTLTSFQEFLPRGEAQSNNLSRWTDDFPYMYPVVENSKRLYSFAYQRNINPGLLHKDLSLFKEFKNLTHVNILATDTNICKLLKDFPNLKLITTNQSSFIYYDECMSNSNIEGVILPSFQNSEWSYKTRVIGIEMYTGTLESLKYFSDLRYLGISRDKDKEKSEIFLNYKDVNELVAFNLLNQLTHFSMNVPSIKNINYLGNLKNLKYLALNCVDNEQKNVPQKCEEPYLNDIDFVSELKRLQYLAISNSNISDLSPISSLSRLKFLKLRENKISSLGDFKQLTSLTYLDLSGNQISKLTKLTPLKNLKFLNISGNFIKDIDPLIKIKSLSFLNLSGNQNPVSMSSISKLRKLKALNLSGELLMANDNLNSIKIDRFSEMIPYLPKIDSKLYWETIFENYQSRKSLGSGFNCKSRPIITDFSLYDFSNLEMLSLRNNNLSEFPNINLLPKLQILDLQRNEIRSISLKSKHSSLILLDMSLNKLSEVPLVKGLTRAKKISLASNDILTIDNLSKFPDQFFDNEEKNNYLDISDNLIQNFKSIETEKFNHIELSLWGNPLDVKTCQDGVLNFFLQQLCEAKKNFEGKELSHEEKKCLIRDN